MLTCGDVIIVLVLVLSTKVGKKQRRKGACRYKMSHDDVEGQSSVELLLERGVAHGDKSPSTEEETRLFRIRLKDQEID